MRSSRSSGLTAGVSHTLRLAFCSALLGACAGVPCARADEAPKMPYASSGDDLTQLSLEELMNVNVLDKQVSSVSGAFQRIGDAPAAIAIITPDDIRRSGLASIPEILRLAPGLQVSQFNGSEWAISSRGFDLLLANKLLVLQDGRTLYNRAFSGVFWSMQDTVIQDIDRIEVIRGPGATIWGANAVNGVINITTKDARDTQGLLVDTRVGTDQQTQTLRYGGQLGEETWYRVYGKFRLSDDRVYSRQVRGGALPVDPGSDANDAWHDARGGFRIDRQADPQSHLTVQGEVSSGQADNTGTLSSAVMPLERPVNYTTDYDAAHLLARWTHAEDPGSEFMLQGYYDHLQHLDTFLAGYRQDTLDLELRHRWTPFPHHELIWGVDARAIFDSMQAERIFSADPSSDTSFMLSAFIQDCWQIVPDRLRLYLGTKLEVNNYSGFEYQPSARILWTPDTTQSVWLGVSRAVRTAGRGEEDGRLLYAAEPTPAGIPAVATFVGDPGTRSEELLAYELGYRIKPAANLSIDVTGFVNSYENLVTSRYYPPRLVAAPPHMDLMFVRANDMSGNTCGAEAAVDWRVASNWRLAASYSWLTADMHEFGSSTDDERDVEDGLPHNQLQLHSYWDITRSLSLNASAYYVDSIALGHIPPFVRLDLNMSWRPSEKVELILGASNLLDSAHPEWGESSSKSVGTEVQRAFFGQMILRF